MRMAMFAALFGAAILLGILAIIFLYIGVFKVLTDVAGLRPVWAYLIYGGFHILLAGGLMGMLGGFALEYWVSALEYPLNVAGRPLASWPAFVVPAYECTILAASLSAVVGMFALNGLPQPYHPLFNVMEFENASRDKFYLCIESVDEQFDPGNTRKFLEDQRPNNVWEVPY